MPHTHIRHASDMSQTSLRQASHTLQTSLTGGIHEEGTQRTVSSVALSCPVGY